MKEKIIITGDIHGYWKYLNTLLNKKKPDKVIVCGDFGYWPHMNGNKAFGEKGKPWNQYGIKNPVTDILWLDGNHENHEEITIMVVKCGHHMPIRMNEFEKANNSKYKPVYYMPRCSRLDINNYRCLFLGGALSIDKDSRVEGVSWWRNEVMSHSDYLNFPEGNYDIIFSHTIPTSIMSKLKIPIWNSGKLKDPSCDILDAALLRYKPKRWYFGHFHQEFNFKMDGCEFIGLDMAGNHGKWWCYL